MKCGSPMQDLLAPMQDLLAPMQDLLAPMQDLLAPMQDLLAPMQDLLAVADLESPGSSSYGWSKPLGNPANIPWPSKWTKPSGGFVFFKKLLEVSGF